MAAAGKSNCPRRRHPSKTITATGAAYAVYWENGDQHVEAQTIYGEDDPTIATQASTTPTGKMWVQADEIISNGTVAAACSFVGSDATAQMWINALEIRSLVDTISTVSSGKVYVTAQKIGSTSGIGVLNSGDGKLWVTAQKITAPLGTSSSGTGITHLFVEQYEEAGSSGQALNVISGTFDLWGGAITRTIGSGISVSGGTVNLHNIRIDTSGTSSYDAVTVSGGTLNLSGCSVTSNAAKKDINRTAGTANVINGRGTNADGTFVTSGTVNYDSETFNGDIQTGTIGKTLKIKSGTNAKAGTFTLSSGAATVSNTSITANSVVMCSVKTSSGTPGIGSPEIVLNSGTGFTATGATTDNSTYNFIVLEVN